MSPEALLSGRRVLVTGVGGPSGISVVRALEPQGAVVWCTDIDPYAAGLYLVPAGRRLLVPRGDDPAYAETMLELCEQREIEVVVPTVDSELLPLARARGRFEAAGASLVVAEPSTLETCLDKWALHARCAGSAPHPATRLLDATFDPDEQTLPVIVKPRSGSGSRGVRLVESHEELARVVRDGTLLAQEPLPGAEYSLDVLATAEGRVVSVVPRERLKIDSGIAITGRTLHDERLEEIGASVAVRVGLTYTGNVQVKEDRHGEPALLEVNPRFPGTMPLTVASGVDMPVLCVAHALGHPLPEHVSFREIAMVRTYQEHFLPSAELQELERAAPARAGAKPVVA